MTVHPHACGEHRVPSCDCCNYFGSSPRLWGTFLIMDIQTLIAGSSPRLWGTYKPAQKCPSEYRFIPTPVGNISYYKLYSQHQTVHPHACGEHINTLGHRINQYGSSPRLWGTYLLDEKARRYSRFIPTPVGNILPLPVLSLPISVHPHACGEHSFFIELILWVCGSSPRLWGT